MRFMFTIWENEIDSSTTSSRLAPEEPSVLAISEFLAELDSYSMVCMPFCLSSAVESFLLKVVRDLD